MFNKASTSICTSNIVVSPDPLSPTPISLAMKTPENMEEDPDDSEPADIDISFAFHRSTYKDKWVGYRTWQE
jgi:hypothetical protein